MARYKKKKGGSGGGDTALNSRLGRGLIVAIAVVAMAVLRHRIMLTYRADADGVSRDSIIQALLDQTNVV